MSDELDMVAAEYVLGTLPSGERSVFAKRLESDPAARRAVRSWEARLDPLLQSAPASEPSPDIWKNIDARLSAMPTVEPAMLPAVPATGRLAVWRTAAFTSMALAAASLALLFISGPWQRAGTEGTRYVAVVDTGGHEPALIAEVDTGTGLIRVRGVAAQIPQGRSLELWHVAEGHPPRSLGILDAGLSPQSIQGQPSAEPVNGQIAVTVEPAGGSPSGAPTGPVVYSGRLVPMDE